MTKIITQQKAQSDEEEEEDLPEGFLNESMDSSEQVYREASFASELGDESTTKPVLIEAESISLEVLYYCVVTTL